MNSLAFEIVADGWQAEAETPQAARAAARACLDETIWNDTVRIYRHGLLYETLRRDPRGYVLTTTQGRQ